MKRARIVTYILLVGIALSGYALSEEKPAKPQTNCPVMGGKINKDVFVDFKGKRIYFCCPECIKSFNKTPEKFVKKMESQGITLAKAVVPQALCPIMGGKINKEVFTDYNGKRIYFCCPGCIDKFKKAPDKYVKVMEAKGITLDSSPNAKKKEGEKEKQEEKKTKKGC